MPSILICTLFFLLVATPILGVCLFGPTIVMSMCCGGILQGSENAKG
jgi:hypothetical protein